VTLNIRSSCWRSASITATNSAWLESAPSRQAPERPRRPTRRMQRTRLSWRPSSLATADVASGELSSTKTSSHSITVDGLTAELEAARAVAMEEKQASAAVSAILGKAKLHGLIVDKAKVDADLRVTHEQALREIQASLGDAP